MVTVPTFPPLTLRAVTPESAPSTTAAPEVSTYARSSRRVLLIWFGALAVGLTAIISLSSAHLSEGEAPRYGLDRFDAVLGPWLQWDAVWYTRIAEHGYDDHQVELYDQKQESAAAFFPGYPLVVRAATPLFGETGLAEIAITLASGAALVVLLLTWCQRRELERAARLTVLLLLLFPYGYFLIAAPYGDALFMAATLAAFLLVEDDRPVLAGLAGAVATATRPVGIAVILALVVLVLQRRAAWQWRPRPGVVWSKLRRADGGVLLSCAGVAGFMAFLWVRFGSPVAYSIAQRGWDQGLGMRTLLKVRFFEHVMHDPRPGFVLRLTIQAALVLVFLAAIPQVWKRYGAAYGLYTLLVLGVPTIGSAAFFSVGRYVLAAFPVFALAGAWLAERPQRLMQSLLVTSAIALAVSASFYGRGFLMA